MALNHLEDIILAPSSQAVGQVLQRDVALPRRGWCECLCSLPGPPPSPCPGGPGGTCETSPAALSAHSSGALPLSVQVLQWLLLDLKRRPKGYQPPGQQCRPTHSLQEECQRRSRQGLRHLRRRNNCLHQPVKLPRRCQSETLEKVQL